MNPVIVFETCEYCPDRFFLFFHAFELANFVILVMNHPAETSTSYGTYVRKPTGHMFESAYFRIIRRSYCSFEAKFRFLRGFVTPPVIR
jgi:hypothetical protein